MARASAYSGPVMIVSETIGSPSLGTATWRTWLPEVSSAPVTRKCVANHLGTERWPVLALIEINHQAFHKSISQVLIHCRGNLKGVDGLLVMHTRPFHPGAMKVENQREMMVIYQRQFDPSSQGFAHFRCSLHRCRPSCRGRNWGSLRCF